MVATYHNGRRSFSTPRHGVASAYELRDAIPDQRSVDPLDVLIAREEEESSVHDRSKSKSLAQLIDNLVTPMDISVNMSVKQRRHEAAVRIVRSHIAEIPPKKAALRCWIEAMTWDDVGPADFAQIAKKFKKSIGSIRKAYKRWESKVVMKWEAAIKDIN